MIRLTGAIVALTLGLVIVGALQWNAMRGQLREMQSGGVDTGHIASANVQQMSFMAALALATKDQADRTKNFLIG